MNNMFGLYANSPEDDKIIARWEIDELRRQLSAAEYKACIYNFWHIPKRFRLHWKLAGAYERLDKAVFDPREQEQRRSRAPFRV